MNGQLVVYRITNLINKRIYIGSSGNFEARKSEHLGQLRQRKHCNRFLQLDFNVYKEAAFVFEVLQDDFKNRDQMLLREYELILKTKGNNYNVDTDCPVVTGRTKGKYKSTFRFMASFKKKGKHKRKAKSVPIKTEFPVIDKILARKKERELNAVQP